MTKFVSRILVALLALSFSGLAFGQNGKLVTVTVSDDVGPVAGAAVTIKGTTVGVVTDLDGKAVLNNVPAKAVLEVSCLGYLPQEVEAAKSAVSVFLQVDSQVLDDVIVIGYGTAKRKDYTGSVSSVKLQDSPIALANNLNPLEAIKGNVPGLDVGATNSAGGSPGMQIRGQRSISGDSDPLIVVDGAIFMGSMNDINPNDVASFDVLKDATSAAAFGSRSANGVIVITTKKGRSQKPVFTFNTTGSVQYWNNRPEVMGPDQWIKTVMARNNAADLSWMTPQEKANMAAGKETNWFDLVSRTGYVQDHQLSVSGAGSKINYYLSGTYSQNQGIVVGDDYSRISVLSKTSADITNWMQVGVDASFTHQDYSGAGASLSRAYSESPYGVCFRDEAQTLLERYPDEQGSENPLWGVIGGTRDNTDVRNNFRINTYGLIKCPWIDGLSYRISYAGYLKLQRTSDFYYESYFVPTGPTTNEARYSSSKLESLLSQAEGTITNYTTYSWVFDNILNYNKTFGVHSVDLTAVATRDRQVYDWLRSYGSDFTANGNTSLGIYGLQKATTQKITMGGSERANIGYLARGMYSYDDRYFLTASYRRDGASVFGENKKWGNYVAFGLAWKLTNEAFFPASIKANVLNNLKLKASWGRNGNQSVEPFATFSTMKNGVDGGTRYEFGDSTILYGIAANDIGNADLGWESTTATNLGFESAWLKNRIFLDMDVYVSHTTDQIFTRKIPVMIGFAGMKTTMGQVDNFGIEATLKTINIRKNDFTWDTSVMFWINRNTLVHLYGEDTDGDGKEDDDVSSGLFIGKHLGAIYGYRQDGIVQMDDTEYRNANGVAPGTPKYVDISGNGTIGPEDREILGYTSPNFRLNISNTFTYKNFELYCLLTGTFGGNGYYLKSNTAAYMVYSTMFSNNGVYIPWWTPQNQSNVYPAATFGGDSRFLGLQSRAFVRLQDVTLSYNLRNEKIKSFGINALKVFLSAKNIMTLTKWEGADPETGAGVSSGTYPILTSVSLGANINF